MTKNDRNFTSKWDTYCTATCVSFSIICLNSSPYVMSISPF